jgi:hypothetical protein
MHICTNLLPFWSSLKQKALLRRHEQLACRTTRCLTRRKQFLFGLNELDPLRHVHLYIRCQILLQMLCHQACVHLSETVTSQIEKGHLPVIAEWQRLQPRKRILTGVDSTSPVAQGCNVSSGINEQIADLLPKPLHRNLTTIGLQGSTHLSQARNRTLIEIPQQSDVKSKQQPNEAQG